MVRTSISEEDAKYLDKLKQRLHVSGKGYTDVITKVIKKQKKLRKTLKKLQRRIAELETQLNQPPLEPAKESTPEDITKTLTRPTPPIETSQCPFYSLVDDIVHCSKDYDQRGVIRKVTKEVCTLCWNRQEKAREQARNLNPADLPCLCRYEHEGNFYCGLRPAKARKLEHGLKQCQACPERLTEEKVALQGDVLTTKKYVTCGATENVDKTRGLMLYSRNKKCPHQNRWITTDQCEEAKCPFLKKVKVKL